MRVAMGLFIAKVNNPVAFLPDPATVSPQAGTSSVFLGALGDLAVQILLGVGGGVIWKLLIIERW
jgi:hypothetical protein